MSDIVRKLASVRRVEEIRAIEGADRIVQYRVGGWWAIDQVGKYEVGDLVIYVEIDSFVPNTVAPFLTKSDRFPKEYNGIQGERLKTIRLKGALSQGLLLPLDVVGWEIIHSWKEDPESVDVTEILGIQKWESPVPSQLAGFARGNFPSVVPKTDQERIQNCWKDVQRRAHEVFEVSQKLDGSSMTVLYTRHEEYGEDFQVCSRNLSLKEDENNTFWKVALRYDLPNKMSALGRNIAIQMELVGEGIQGNPEKLKDQDAFVFDIYDVDAGVYLSSEERRDLVADLGLKHVPVIGYQNLTNETVDSLLSSAEGTSLVNGGVNKVREGLVYKSTQSQFSFKCISNKFLLGEK